MRLTDQQLARFNDMVRDFSMRNGLTAETKTECLNMGQTDVYLSNGNRFKWYTVIWKEVRSLTEAGTNVFADAINFFGINVNTPAVSQFDIHRVIFQNPATIVLWEDGTKTVVKCQEGDEYSKEVGLALCFAKKALGNKSNFNNVFKKWIPEEEEEPVEIVIPKMDPSDAMIAQAAIQQMQAKPFRSAAEILEELSESIRKRGNYPRGV